MPLVPLPILLEAGIGLVLVVVLVRESGVNFGERQESRGVVRAHFLLGRPPLANFTLLCLEAWAGGDSGD